MEEVTRKRLLRRLETLPEEQLYQALDFIEFLEAKYARAASRKPDAFQQFAERVEDQMRVRALAPKAMRGTMRVMSTASRVLDGVRDLGRGLVAPESGATSRPAEPVRQDPPTPGPGAGPTSTAGSTPAPITPPEPRPASEKEPPPA
jgi:hypothetical protein